MKKPQIIAMGGGGFSMEPENPLLDEYFLSRTGKRTPRICFLPTASGDSESYITRFYTAFRKLKCQPTHLSLFRPRANLEEFLLGQDAIYVGGGNTKNLLALWREWGLNRILRRAWRRGVVLGGISAGSICWFEQGLTDSLPGRLTPFRCLGFLKGSNCPHYDGEAKRRPAYRNLIRRGKLKAGLAAEDGVALHFIDNKLARVVSSRLHADAFSLKLVGDGLKEEKIVPEYLRNSNLKPSGKNSSVPVAQSRAVQPTS